MRFVQADDTLSFNITVALLGQTLTEEWRCLPPGKGADDVYAATRPDGLLHEVTFGTMATCPGHPLITGVLADGAGSLAGASGGLGHFSSSTVALWIAILALILCLSVTVYLLWVLRTTQAELAKHAERLVAVEARKRAGGADRGGGGDGRERDGDRVEGNGRVASRLDLWREAAAIEVTDVEIRCMDSVGSSASLSVSGVDLCSDNGAESDRSGTQGEAPPANPDGSQGNRNTNRGRG